MFGKKNEYVIYATIGSVQGWVGNDLEKGEDNIYSDINKAMVLTDKNKAVEMACLIDSMDDSYDVTAFNKKTQKKIY